MGTFYKKITIALLNIFIVMNIYSGIDLFIDNAGISQHYIVSIPVVAGIVSLTYICSPKLQYLNIDIINNYLKKKWTVIFVFFAIPLVVKLMLFFFFKYTPQSGDHYNYYKAAYDLYNYGKVQDPLAGYCYTWHHVFWVGTFLAPSQCISNTFAGCEIYLIFLTSVGGLLLYSSAKKIWGELTAAVATMIYSYMPSSLFMGIVVTHEIVTMIVAITCLYFISVSYKEDGYIRYLFVVLVTLAMSYASFVNAAGISYFIAYCMMILIYYSDKWHKKMATLLLALVTYVLCSQFSVPIQKTLSDTDEAFCVQEQVGITLFNGASEEHAGRFNPDDNLYIQEKTIEIYGDDASVEETADVALDLAKARWMDLLTHPYRLFKLWIEKYSNLWAGTHYSIEMIRSMNQDFIAKKVVLNCLMGVNNLIWILLNIVALMGFERINGEIDIVAIGLSTTFFGVVCMFLLCEVQNKFNIPALIPLYVVLANYMVKGITNAI